MEQKRVFKMGVIERNMLLQSMYTIFVNEKKNGGDYTTVGNLILRIGNATNHKVYLSEDDYKLARTALNILRDSYLAADRYSDGIDKVLYKLINAKIKLVKDE
ncbi:MAG: hypothetical protein RR848_03220 [Oscillospiraceae bacterium]